MRENFKFTEKGVKEGVNKMRMNGLVSEICRGRQLTSILD